MKQHLKRNAFFYIVILGLAIFSLYQYFNFNITLSNYQDAWEDQRQEVSFYTKQAMDSSTIGVLTFATKSLVWAVRSEMISENYEQVNRYISDLEKDMRVKQVLICDTAASIKHASKKQLVGQSFSSVYDQDYLQLKTITVEMGEGGNMHLIAPIMGLNARIGTLFLVYKNEMPQVLRKVAPLEVE